MKDEGVAEGTSEAVETSPLDLFTRDFDADPAREPEDAGDEQGEEGEESEEEGEVSPDPGEQEEGSEEAELEEDEEETEETVGKFGEDNVVVPDKTTFEIETEGGENVVVSLKEMKNAYRTRQQIHREFSKIDVDRKENLKVLGELKKVKRQYDFIDSQMKLVMDYAQAGDIMGAAQVALSLGSKGDPNRLKSLVKQANELTDRLADMTDEEKELYFSRAQVDLDKKQLERDRKEEGISKAREEFRSYVNTIKNTHNISDDEMSDARRKLLQLDEHRKTEGKPPYLPEKLPAKEVAQKCAQFVLAGRHHSRIVKIVNAVSPKRANDDAFISNLTSLCEPGYSDKDIQDIVRGSLGMRKVSAKDTKRKASKRSASAYGLPSSNGSASRNGATSRRIPNSGSGAEKDSGGSGPILSYEDIIAKAEQEG